MTPRAVIKNALAFQGAWYVWGGKGYVSWSPDGLKKTEYTSPVFDCSGLVTVAMKQAGGPDWVATHNARKLMDSCPTIDELKFGAPAAGSLCFYGRVVDVDGVKTTKIDHVTLSIGGGYMIEAAGGDRTTTSVDEAKKKNARVRVSEFRTAGFIGARLLP